MNGFLDKMQSVLIPFSQKINNNKILKGISGGFSAMLPVVMVGAIFTLLANLNIGIYQTFITNIGLKSILSIPVDYTTNMISLYAVFLIAKATAAANDLEERDSVSAGLIALMVFLILCPLGVSGTDEVSGVTVNVAGALNTTFLGSAGLFTSMLLGVIVPNIYSFFVKKKITLKMPDSVPPAISKSFTAMIPALCIAALAVVVRVICAGTSYGSLTMMIYGLLRAPLQSLGASPITIIILLLVCNVLWFFGIHGGMVATAIMNVIYTQMTLENLAAYGAGEALPHLITTQTWFVLGNIGGSGCAIGLCICIALFAKSARYKSLRKVSTAAGLCSISEPMVFGVPLVLNPVMLIPMLVAPVVTFLLGWGAMVLGLVPYLNGVTISTGTPVLLSAFIGFGDWRGVVLQAVLIIVSVVIYYPFFRMIDNQAIMEENSVENN